MSESIEFSGLESDQFVSFADRLLRARLTCEVEAWGREPITSTSLGVSGLPVEATDAGYSRTLLIRNSNGSHFRIGGTNTTKSIACERLLFDATCLKPLGVEVARDDTLSGWLKRLEDEDGGGAVDAIEALMLGIRSKSIVNGHDELRACAERKLASLSPSVRTASLSLIGLLGGPKALAPLVAALHDDEAIVRRQAALRLRGMDSVIAANPMGATALKCVDELANTLLGDPDEQVRIYAAEDLGYFYNEGAIQALAGAVEHDASEDVRWACTVAIGRSNDVDAISVLLDVLGRETGGSIRRAALLGIGRHAADLVLRRSDSARDAAALLAAWIVERKEGVDYAIHALGEFGAAAASYTGLLVESLTDDGIEVISSVTLAIAKLLPYAGLEPWREPIIEALSQKTDPSPPTEWPAVGFHRAYLNSAGDLALTLEDFDLAARIFDAASAIEDQPEWLRTFHRGAACYARTEARVAAGDSPAEAIMLLETALECFSKVSSSEAFAEADPGRSGLRLKQILAEARLAVLSALQSWRPHLFEAHDLEAMNRHLEQANALYRRLDLTNLSENEAKLSAREVALIYSLQIVVGILSEACHLAQSLLEHDAEAVGFALGAVRAQCRRLSEQAEATESVSLCIVRDRLRAILERTEDTSRSSVEIATETLDLLPAALNAPAPTPGTCPIVNFGEASLTVAPADAISGAGTRDDPFLVPDDMPVVFEASVHVRRRTKDDELIFSADSRVGARADGIQYVPVHEGRYVLRPVEFGPVRPSAASTPFEFNLSFRNRGCLQPVSSCELWVRARAGHAAANAAQPSPHVLEALESEVEELEERLTEVDRAIAEGRPTPALTRRRRQFRDELDTKKAEAQMVQERLQLDVPLGRERS
jgi:HEAT repeat protein